MAAVNLTSDPIAGFPAGAEALADIEGAAIAAAFQVARHTLPDAEACRLTVIGMGKCGGQELNYISDVDVIFVAEPADDATEEQALLKVRPIAGDEEIGTAYLEAIQPMVWRAVRTSVEDVQAMRRRVEQHVPRAEVTRQLKLGSGGLRDIEFSMQLLQIRTRPHLMNDYATATRCRRSSRCLTAVALAASTPTS